MKLIEIAHQLECKLRGSGDIEVTGAAGIGEAKENEITFVSNPKYLAKIKSTRAGAIILSPDSNFTSIPTLISQNPYRDFARCIELFYKPPIPTPGVHPTAYIDENVTLGENYSIGAGVVIAEGVRLGKNATLYPNVVLYPHAVIGENFIAHSNSVVREFCKIGDRVILQNGVVVGSDGFGFAPEADGSYYKIVQSGIVVVENDVEVGANTCIDRATVGETRVGKGTKIDNLVQVGHGSHVGQHTILAAQVGLAGSTQVGNQVTLAGQVGTAGHISIGDGVVATGQTGIVRSVEREKTISGTPMMDSVLWRRNHFLMLEFPKLVRTVTRLKKEIEKLRKVS